MLRHAPGEVVRSKQQARNHTSHQSRSNSSRLKRLPNGLEANAQGTLCLIAGAFAKIESILTCLVVLGVPQTDRPPGLRGVDRWTGPGLRKGLASARRSGDASGRLSHQDPKFSFFSRTVDMPHFPDVRPTMHT